MQGARTLGGLIAMACAAAACPNTGDINGMARAMAAEHDNGDAPGPKGRPPAATTAQVSGGSGVSDAGSSGAEQGAPAGTLPDSGGEVPIGVPLSEEEWRALKERAREAGRPDSGSVGVPVSEEEWRALKERAREADPSTDK